MTSDYAVWAADSLSNAGIVRKVSRYGATGVIEPMVFAYGCNDDFIIAKRHPVDEEWKVDTSITEWFVIEVPAGSVHGPLTKIEYIDIREKLGVPDDVTFSTIVRR